MSNPWASSFDEYRQTIIGEGKGKKEPRWQDDDCDGKWYEKSDTDGKISKREKKAKAKHYKEEKYDNTKSPDYKKKKKALAKKHGGAKNIKGHPQYEHHGIDIEHIDGSVTEITDVIKAPKMVAAPKLSNWREDFVWDEALKTPKLELEGDGKKDVKNKVEINPTVATEGYMSKDKEGHTTGGFRISNKEAKKAKERLKKKYKKEEVEQIDEMDNVGGKAAAVLATGGLALGGALFNAARNAANRLKKKQQQRMQRLDMGEGKAKGLDGKACWDGYKLAGTKKKGGKTVDNCVKEEEKKKLTERDVYIKSWNRNPLSGLPDYKQDKKRKIKTANPMPVDKASYEPEGDVLSDGYQRNPERDTRSARQRRMDSPDRGINSPAFRAFMAAQQKPSKPKKKKDVKEEVVTELNRYEKETGKSSGSMNMPKGRPTKKGGTSSPVMRAVRTSIRKETGKPHGQKKKTKGVKGNPQPGDRKTTPADTIAKRRQSKADAEKLMRDTSGT